MREKDYTFLFLLVKFCSAHWDGAYFRNPDDGFVTLNTWMTTIPNSTLITEIAHDSAAWGSGNDILYTQCLNFDEQLRYGIRFFDIRIRHYRNGFPLHHGVFYLNQNFGDFLRAVDNFLKLNPTEMVLFRLKEDHKAEQNNRSIIETLDSYLIKSNRYLKVLSSNITMGQARGRFIIMSDGRFNSRGIQYGSARIQDSYHLTTNWNLHRKWEKVKSHLKAARNGQKTIFFINYLSGSGGCFPFFVASGHIISGTSAPKLATGLTTPAWRHSFPDFPRANCFIGICSIVFEGTNILARDNIKYFNNRKGLRSAGIIVADFPGKDLILETIRSNFVLNEGWKLILWTSAKLLIGREVNVICAIEQCE